MLRCSYLELHGYRPAHESRCLSSAGRL